MTEALYIALAFGVGFGSAFQVGMLGLLNRDRGSFEASWISMLGSIAGLVIVMSFLALFRDQQPSLASPLDKPYVYVALIPLSLLGLALSVKGLHPALAITGLFGFAYVLASAFLVPKIGVALYIAVVTAGTLAGGVGLDHYGAFGSAVIRVDGLKVAGLVFLMAGVVLIRGR